MSLITKPIMKPITKSITKITPGKSLLHMDANVSDGSKVFSLT